MSFRLKRNAPIGEGLRRAVRERLDRAATAVECAHQASSDDVHTARRRYKQARAALRLLRDDLGETVFKRENHCYRDCARPLAPLRDATALVDCIDEFAEQFDGRIETADVIAIRSFAVARRRTQRETLTRERDRLRAIAQVTRRARKRAKKWRLRSRGLRALRKGMRRIYRDGRRAMLEANATPGDAALHEWRKRAKDLRYALELLDDVSVDFADAFALRARVLTDLLGDDHDLAMLRVATRNEFASTLGNGRDHVLALIDERRTALQRQSFVIGATLYRAKPRDFARCVTPLDPRVGKS